MEQVKHFTENPVTKHCVACGGQNVMRDAWATWDAELQLWVLGSTFDQAYCEDCDGETSIVDKPIEK